MIIDLKRFIDEEKQYWTALDEIIDRLEKDPEHKMSLKEINEFHYLYQRTSADLAKLTTFASDPEIHSYLESLVSRAYGEIHESRESFSGFSPVTWLFATFPMTFRKHIRAFALSIGITIVGITFGLAAVGFDPEAKEIIMPFQNLHENPSERVSREESVRDDRLKNVKMSGASWYMTHNTKVSIFTIALGITWGIGTAVMLFYNGVILGAVAIDYILADQSTFLLAWLSPHGVIEIPAILLAGQAGFVLAGAIISRKTRVSLRARFREVSGDIVTLCAGVALMLVWAGIIEAFISQYHEPVLPYSFKIGFAVVEFLLLILFLSKSGASNVPK